MAYTGLETVANYAAETREPGRSVPRAGFLAVGLAVLMATLAGAVGVGVFPLARDPGAPDGVASALATDWLRAPLVGIVTTFEAALPGAVVDVLRTLVGLAGVVVLVATVTTSLSGAGRLAYALARREMLPRAFARPARRSAVAPAATVAAAATAAALLIASAEFGTAATTLAGIYSFGVLMAFTAAQVAVVRLRLSEPDLPRPFRIRGNVRIRGRPVPLAPLVGAPITLLLWIGALVTHEAARAAGPAWLALGIVLYVATRHRERAGLLERVEPATPDLFPTPEGAYRHILVPLKLSVIGEEVLATAVKLAEENRARVNVLHVLRVPLEQPLDEPLAEEAAAAEASIAEARELAAEHGVVVEGAVVRARSIGEAIVARAESADTDLIVLGSSPRWRRQSRFLSPTVDHVLRHAHCEVMVVAYPEGVLEEAGVE